LNRTSILFAAAGAVACLLGARTTHAQQFPIPGKPVRIVVAIGSGTPPDVLARVLAPKLAAELNVPVVVENKPGAGFILGTMEVVRAAPDGHTLLISPGTSVMMQTHMVAKLPYDPFVDLAPVIALTRAPLVMVASMSAPFTNLAEFLAYARANPGKLNFGTQAINSAFDLGFEQLKRSAKIDVPIIPFKSTADVVQGLLSGQIQLSFMGAGQALGLHRSGKIRALSAVEDQRIPILPDVPTLAELGMHDVTVRGGIDLFGPGKLSQPIVDRLNAALQNALRTPEVMEVSRNIGYPIVGGSAAEMTKDLRSQHEVWGAVIRSLGIKSQ
jgi:tripartite-type tricarboxylate transporter receptor subunit TctC